MSAPRGGLPVPMVGWNLDVEPGDPVDIYGHPFIFERVDADHAVTFRPPAGAEAGDFMVIGEDGRPRKPFVHEVADLMIDNNLVWREKPLKNEVRRVARAQECDAQQAREMDPLSQFRMAICRRFDANPWSRSDYSLHAFMKEALSDPVIAALPGAWQACPATIRTWLNERGIPGCRKERDGTSMKNRTRKIRMLNHPLEILFYWAVRAKNVRGDIQMNYDRYVADIVKINDGEPLNRNFWIDPEGLAGPCERPAQYRVPNKPYVATSYSSFWRLCTELNSEKAHGRKTSAKGAYQRYGGGGNGDLPTHLGALCWIDSTPVPKAFFVDDQTGIPIGLATMTLMTEHRSKAAPGWDLCPGAASSSSVLRTVLCANQPKQVPEDLLRIDPNLTWLRLRPDSLRFDNATEHHGLTVEDVLADAGITAEWAGSEMPRDKNVMERVIGTFLTLLFKYIPDANYDVALMRQYGFKPEEGQVLCSIQKGRELLARAVMTYNVRRHRGLDKRQPALVWKKALGNRKLNALRDADKFARSIGTVAYAKMTNAGIERFNRRYTPGAAEMKRIVQQFERALRVPKGDTAPKPKAQRDERKRLNFEVKIRIDEGDIGRIQVWNPYAAQWEDFACTNPDAHGMPLWLHQRCLELAQREAMDYLSPQGQAVVLARLYEEIANVDSKAAERERRDLAKALDDPNLRRVMSSYVEVVDETVAEYGEPQPEEHEPARHDLTIGMRKDAHLNTPRQRPGEPKKPVTMRRSAQGSSRSKGDAAAPSRDPAAPPPRHKPRFPKNDDRRNAGVHPKSANRPDQRAPSRPRSNRLKWGDVS